MHLVPEEKVETFLAAMREEYYRKHGFSEEKIREGLFASKPGAGACVLEDLECVVCWMDDTGRHGVPWGSIGFMGFHRIP